jgi:Holliday junction resolvase-like predicted endonuclease
MVNRYRRGRIAEKKVADWLKRFGFRNVRRSKGSKGPYDIYAVSPSGVKTYVQVKSHSARLSRKERRKLREVAKERRGFAAYVHYGGRGKFKLVPLGNWGKKRKKKEK